MANVDEIGSAAGRMCGHVAAALCKFVVQRNPQIQGEKGCTVADIHMTDWGAAEEALWAIGVMKLEPRGDGSGRGARVFSMNAEEMPRHLASAISEADPRIDILLAAFIAIACGYGKPILSDERDWFDPPPHYATAVQWLARCGYAEQRGDAFRWTEKIGPAMRASNSWTQNNLSVTTLESKRQQTECELIWAAIPDTLKQAIKSNKIGVIDLAAMLARRWKNGQWQAFNSDDDFSFAGHILLAGDLMKLATRPE